jgi:predicted ferric reductase
MAPTPVTREDDLGESSINIQFFISLLLAMIVGLLLATLVLPKWLPNMATSLTGSDPKVYWYLSRGTAFISLSLLWLSMALGLGMTNKMARLWPGAPASFAIHEYVSLLGLAFAIFHGLVLLGDHYINFTLTQIIMPFTTTSYRPLWVGLGQIGFYIWVIVAMTFYIRQIIGQKTWRLIHYLSLAIYLLGLVHGLFSGTDSPTHWAQQYYWISGGILLFLFIYRIVATIADKLARTQKPNRPPQSTASQPSPITHIHNRDIRVQIFKEPTTPTPESK